jgi:hypothetical protein
MIALIVDNHAHRLMNDGSVESCEVSSLGEILTGQNVPDDVAWRVLDPISDLQMDPGTFDAFIRKDLVLLNSIFPPDRPKLPVSEKQETVGTVVAPV